MSFTVDNESKEAGYESEFSLEDIKIECLDYTNKELQEVKRRERKK